MRIAENMEKIVFHDKYKLTHAVLTGRKSQMRIPANLNKVENMVLARMFRNDNVQKIIQKIIKRSPFKEGSFVAIAQPYKEFITKEEFKARLKHTAGWSYKNGIMPYYMRHYIRIVRVRLEKLNDISEDDSLKSGVVKVTTPSSKVVYHVPTHSDLSQYRRCFRTPQQAYLDLFQKVYKNLIISDSLYVYVIDFKLVM